jgi:nicotinate-nucleotide adenylyltransferase
MDNAMETGPQLRRLCFGGSFNPIHYGHLICSRVVAQRGGFDQVVLIPSRQPPHKPGQTDLASPENRLAMCRLAVERDPLYAVDDIEMRRTGPSFTIDTIREFRHRGWGKVSWLIGADMLNYLPKWHEPYALLAEVDFVVMARPGFEFEWESLPEPFQKLRENVVSTPEVNISATEIRHRVARGEPIDALTPPAVVEYIMSHDLYRAAC